MRFKEFSITESFTIANPAGRIGADVADVQKALVALGYELPRFGVDGIHGPETTGAIKKFQTDAKLMVNGDTDDATIDILNKLVKDRNIKLEKSTDKDVKRQSAQRSAANIDTKVIQDPDFNKKLEKIADQLNVKSSDLISIMKQESRVDPKAVNPYSGASGLIQFMPATGKRLCRRSTSSRGSDTGRLRRGLGRGWQHPRGHANADAHGPVPCEQPTQQRFSG